MNIRNFFAPLVMVAGLIPGMASAALLGLIIGQPTLDFAGSGMVAYDAATGTVTISGIPVLLYQDSPYIEGEVLGTGPDDEHFVTIQFKVDGSGHLIAGTAALTVKGSIDVDFDGIPDYDGVLLQADATEFGFQDGGIGSDSFDMRFNNITGALAPLYAGKDIALNMVSEISTEFPSAFNGSFAADFVGQAKGILGSADPVVVAGECDLGVDAFCSVNGGPLMTKCRIKVTKSSCHWEHETKSYHGNTCNRSKYGMHGAPEPTWVKKYPATNVLFTYVVTNTGTTPISNLAVDDSFDTAVPGVPTTLAPGASVTLTRTMAIRDELNDTVTVMGEFGTAMCSAHDNVTITDKMREMKLHDLDHYKGKW